MWDVWSSPTPMRYILLAAVFLVVPLLAGCVHRSWRVGWTAILLPVVAIGIMFVLFALLMLLG
jgi:hypothetical protein